MKNLFIMDYEGHKTVIEDVDLDNLEEIESIHIQVVSGDEICTITYIDGVIVYDSFNCRCIDYHDYAYFVYDKSENINIIDEFLRRKDSYSMERWFFE